MSPVEHTLFKELCGVLKRGALRMLRSLAFRCLLPPHSQAKPVPPLASQPASLLLLLTMIPGP